MTYRHPVTDSSVWLPPLIFGLGASSTFQLPLFSTFAIILTITRGLVISL